MLELTPKQQTFAEAVFSGLYSYLLFGGAIRAGKLLRVDEPIATPEGWTTMGALRVGDTVFDAEGKPTRVTWVSPVEQKPDAWELVFDDEQKIQCDAGHQWVTLTRKDRVRLHLASDAFRQRRRKNRPSRGKGKRPDLALRNKAQVGLKVPVPNARGSTRTTREIVDTLYDGRFCNHTIVNAAPIETPIADLLIDPYTLGAWLGDGSSNGGGITGLDSEVWESIEAAGYEVTHRKIPKEHYIRGIVGQLRALGVLQNKHIPQQYLRGSIDQRKALLQGLCDTDGHCDKNRGYIEFTTTSPALREGMMELLATLGIKPSCREGRATLKGKDYGPKWRIQFMATFPAFRIQRKLDRQRMTSNRFPQSGRREIRQAHRVSSTPMRCIAVDSPSHTYLAGRAMIPTHNTLCVLAILWVLCKVYPGSRWAVVRKDLPTLRRNTIPSFNKFAPRPFVGEINQGTWVARCANGSEIVFFPESIDRDPDLDRWKGLEVNGFVLEEVNELSEASFEKAIERAGSWLCPGDNQPAPLILMTCNPAGNWVKRTFYDPQITGALKAPYYFLRSTILDNPHLTEAYKKGLETLKTKNPATYKRFVKGDWEAADEPNQLIKFAWVLAAFNSIERIEGKQMLGVDVARYGDDDTVIAHRMGNALTKLEYHSGLSVDQVSDLVGLRIAEQAVDADQVRVDGVGLGAGVVDNLHRAGFKVVEVISGAKAIERTNTDGSPESFYRFFDLRSQMWWDFREALRQGQVCIAIEDPRLIEDLTAPRYTVTGDKVLKVESKDDIKKRIGRSTDAGDAVVYAWAELEDLTFRLNAPLALTTEDEHGNIIGAKAPAWDFS